MKQKLVITVMLLLYAFAALGETIPTQNPNTPYRLFNAQDTYTLLKLDTRTGQIWQVQWGDKDHRFIESINLKTLVSGGKPGRFTLYPTSNIYTFILLDQEIGDTWQVQWGKSAERFIVRFD